MEANETALYMTLHKTCYVSQITFAHLKLFIIKLYKHWEQLGNTVLIHN